eukprot:TRINITY_DN21755_c0_g1_i1.p2 TRINITY_DN21755_c0_g1~~TRINITY_DN21755_c0_g1_i1.p2  ORF type:complete len:169 (-),score=59.19 TRINITY_DN21755_c0_g1_i1:101-562(-)
MQKPKTKDDDDYDLAEEFEEDLQAVDEAAILSEQQQKKSAVDGLLSKGDGKGALQAALANPPTLSKDEATKKIATELVAQSVAAIASAKDADKQIEALVAALSGAEIDVLMKYVYKLLASNTNSAFCLKLHEKLIEKSGIGSVVRVLTDRRTV